MKKTVCLFLAIGIIYSQAADFNFSSNKPENSKIISYHASFWLSELLMINPMSQSRLTISLGNRFPFLRLKTNIGFYQILISDLK